MSLGLAELRILPAAPVDTRPRTLVISFCTVQLRTLYATHSWATLCLFTTSGPDPGELPGFWGSMVFRHAPIPRKGSGKQQQQHVTRKYSTEVISSIKMIKIGIVRIKVKSVEDIQKEAYSGNGEVKHPLRILSKLDT